MLCKMCSKVELINIVKKFPAIWNIKYEKYNDKQELNKAWGQISVMLNCTEQTCRDTWKTICNNFFRNIVNANGSTKSAPYPWADHLAFMLPTMYVMKGKMSHRLKVMAADEDDSSDDNVVSLAESDDDASGDERNVNTPSTKPQMTLAIYQQRQLTKKASIVCPELKEVLQDEWLSFAKSNMSDINALSKIQQRQFKRKVLEAIDELHPKTNN